MRQEFPGIHKLLHRGTSAVIKGGWVPGLEVNERSDAPRISRSQRTQLFSAEGMPHENGLLQLERVQDGEHVVPNIRGKSQIGRSRAE